MTVASMPQDVEVHVTTPATKPGWQTSEVQTSAVVAIGAVASAVAKLTGWPLVAALGIVAALTAVVVVCRTVLKVRT